MTTATITTGQQIGSVFAPASDLTWADLSSSPYGDWGNWPSWQSFGSQVVVQLDDDLGSVGYRTPELFIQYQGTPSITLKISDTGSFTGEETDVTLDYQTPVAFVPGRYYRWTVTVDSDSDTDLPILSSSYNTVYTTQIVEELHNDLDVYSSAPETTITTNLGLVRNIQATALAGDLYVVEDYIIAAQDGTYTRTPRTVDNDDTAVISTSEFKVYTGSFELDQESIGVDMGSLVDHGTQDFTYEAWVNLDASKIGVIGAPHIIQMPIDSAAGGLLNIRGVTTTSEASNWALDIDIYIDGVQRGFTTLPYTLDADTWYHIAIVRNGTDLKGYVDGTAYASYTITGAGVVDTFPQELQIGGPDNAGGAPATNYWKGYIDEVRISDTARYTGTFTPPAWRHTNDPNTLLLLHADDFTDDGGTNFGSDGYIQEQQGGSAVITSKNPPKVQVVDYDGAFWDGTVDAVLRGLPKIEYTDGGVKSVAV